MRTYLTVILGFFIIKLVLTMGLKCENNFEVIENLICIVLTILGIVFVWNI